jgi:hypothetical protein
VLHLSGWHHFLGDALGGRSVKIRQQDPCATCSEQSRRRKADARGSTGEQGDRPFEIVTRHINRMRAAVTCSHFGVDRESSP